MYGSHDMRHTGFPQVDNGQRDPRDLGRHSSSREKRVLPRLGPIIRKTKAKIQAASTRPQSAHPPPAISRPSSSLREFLGERFSSSNKEINF